MSLRARFWLLAGIRWLSTGFIVPVAALLPLDRGLTVAEYGTVAAVQGITVLVLELPTGGFADAIGRRPVWIASAVVAFVSYGVYALAQTPAVFAVATALAGAYRALDSGPLNAWFVDAVHDREPEQTRSAVVANGLSGYASVVGLAIATGAVLSAALVAWAPLGDGQALVVPYWVAAALSVVQIGAAVVLMDEDRSARIGGLVGAIRATPAAILDGTRLLLGSRVLRALVAVEIFWGFGMIAFETLTPIRLSELLGDRDAAAALMGPVTAAAWGVSALGAAMVPLLLRRWSMVAVSVALRLVQGATVVAMGIAGGPVGLVAGLFATYAVHSAAGAIHETLLHEQVGNEQRATVLSLGSMVLHPGASIGLVVLGAVATAASTGAAIVVGGLVLALAAPLFLVRAPAPAAVRGAPMLDREGTPVAPTRLQEASPWANSYDSRSATESGRSDSTGPR
ncbi:MAG: transporter [Aeromicrobium sp.]|jgi:DHA1 family tetracycline resistance protein-like MFS transporter|uniref:MFS transporter n=1 Tax=Aeromicrobium sp. TaxID=1871063 RepID=UPI002623419D|nr:MFS transporter [Aeromicrobium sp.]MCW2823371.1 transporter [Aeromicrobium sp.]